MGLGIGMGVGVDALYLGHQGDHCRKHPVRLLLSSPQLVRIVSVGTRADIPSYTRLMASYNPAMLKNEPYGADWKAAPDLTSFAADYAGASSSGGASGSSAATGAPSHSADSDAAAASAGAGNGAGAFFLRSHLFHIGHS